jgi:hypothetical protein
MSRWWTVAVIGLAACSGSPSGDGKDGDSGSTAEGCTSQDLSVVVGTGELAYEPLNAGDVVTTVHGPQGGWHIWTAVDVSFSEPQVSIQPTVTVPDYGDIQVSGNQQPQFVALSNYDETSCNGQFYGMRSFIDTDSAVLDGLCSGGFEPACDNAQAVICALAGHEMDLCVTVADIVDGRSATSCTTVTAQLDPVDEPACQ